MFYRQAICLVFCIVGFAVLASAQPGFERTYGGTSAETASYIKPTPDHGYILVGTAWDPFYQNTAYYVLKLDSNGNEMWSRIFSDPLSAYGNAIVPTYDGGYAFVGSHNGIFYDGVAEIVRLDSLGNIVNSNAFPPADGWGTAGIGIIETTDSNLAISVYTDGFISQNYYSLYKIAPDLSTSWTSFLSYDGSQLNPHDVIQEKDGSFFSMAYYNNFYYVFPNIPQATSIRKFAADGTLVIDSVFQFYSVSNAITPTVDSGILISGFQDSLNTRWIKLTRLDLNATPVWQKSYSCPNFQDGYSVQQCSDGGFAILNNATGTLHNTGDIELMKVNSAGDSLWSKTYGSFLNESAIHFEETVDHGFVILASTTSFGASKIYVIKTDSLGNIPAEYTLTGFGNYFCEGDTAELILQPLPPVGSVVLWTNGDTIDTIHVTSTGNYSATVIESGGDTLRTINYPVFFASRPLSQIATQDTLSLCTESVFQNLFPNDVSFQYRWYLNDTLIEGEYTSEITPVDPGFYSLIVSNYCGSDTSGVFLDSLFALPAKPGLNAVSPSTICPGDSFRLAAVDTGFTFQWYEETVNGMQMIPTAIDSFIYLRNQNNYQLQVTDRNGCPANSDLFLLTVDDWQVYVNASGPLSFCTGGQIELSAPSGSQYLWSTGDTIPQILVNSSNAYYFSMLSDFGCPKSSDTVVVTVNPLPFISLGPDSIVCDTSSVLLDAGPGFNYYLWQDGSVDQTFLAFSPSMTPDSADYFVFVTDTNGCANSDTIRVYYDICDHVKELTSGNVKISPNPSSVGRELKVILEEAGEGYYLLLYNETSRLVLSERLGPGNTNYVQTRGLASGIYYYRIQSEKAVLGSGLLILQ